MRQSCGFALDWMVTWMLRSLAVVSITLGGAAASFAGAAPVTAQTLDLEGAWAASSYLLSEGAEHRVEGTIFFTDSDWQVLFFVMDDDGVPIRGSAEGGRYRLEGSTLTFIHLHNLSQGEAMEGLDAAPLNMVVRELDEAPNEPTSVAIDGNTLTLSFPSGNRMVFTRSSR